MSEEAARESMNLAVSCAKYFCSRTPGAQVFEGRGWTAAWRNFDVAFGNVIYIAEPIADELDLRDRVAEIAGFLCDRTKPMTLSLRQEWIPENLRDLADQLLAGIGLAARGRITGMERRDAMGLRPSFDPLEFAKVGDEETQQQFCAVNAAAWGLPVETLQAAVLVPGLWSDRFVGYVARLESTPVATAAVMIQPRSLHLMYVATVPGMQRRGYAGAAMKQVLEACTATTGIRRATLHSTELGLAAYLRMGFQETARFTGYGRIAGTVAEAASPTLPERP